MMLWYVLVAFGISTARLSGGRVAGEGAAGWRPGAAQEVPEGGDPQLPGECSLISRTPAGGALRAAVQEGLRKLRTTLKQFEVLTDKRTQQSMAKKTTTNDMLMILKAEKQEAEARSSSEEGHLIDEPRPLNRFPPAARSSRQPC